MYKMLSAMFTTNTKSATPASHAKRPSIIRSPLLQRLTNQAPQRRPRRITLNQRNRHGGRRLLERLVRRPFQLASRHASSLHDSCLEFESLALLVRFDDCTDHAITRSAFSWEHI